MNVPLHTLLIVRSYGYDFKIETVPLKGNITLAYLISLHFTCIYGYIAFIVANFYSLGVSLYNKKYYACS